MAKGNDRATPDGDGGKEYSRVVKLEGDPAGIEGLQALHAADKTYLKFLIGEAKTNTDLKTTFKAPNGRPFVLRVDSKTGNLVVEPAPVPAR